MEEGPKPQKESVRINFTPKSTETPKSPETLSAEKTFKYKAMNSQGKDVEGTMKASSEFAVFGKLKEMSLFPVSAKEMETPKPPENRSPVEELPPIDSPLSNEEPGTEKRRHIPFWNELSSKAKKIVGIATAATVLGGGGIYGVKKALEHKDKEGSSPVGTAEKVNIKKEISYEKLRLQLPEEERKYIDETLNTLRGDIKYSVLNGFINNERVQRENMELLKSEPIKYFTEIKEGNEKKLKNILDSDSLEKEEKDSAGAPFVAEIARLQKIINALTTANGNETAGIYKFKGTNWVNPTNTEASISTNKPPTPKVSETNSAPATLSAEITPTNKPPTVEEIEKRLDEKFNAKLEEFKRTNSAPLTPDKITPKTHNEIIAEIEAKLARGEQITADEALMHNREIPVLRQKAIAERMATENAIAEKIALERREAARIAQIPKAPDRINATEGGYVHPYQPPTMNTPRPPTTETFAKNQLHLSPKELEKVNIVYDSNIEKIFPGDDAPVIWLKIQNEEAYKWMHAKNVQKKYKILVDHLNNLGEVTETKPSRGIRERKPETVGQFMERAYEAAEKQGKLDKVTLK